MTTKYHDHRRGIGPCIFPKRARDLFPGQVAPHPSQIAGRHRRADQESSDPDDSKPHEKERRIALRPRFHHGRGHQRRRTRKDRAKGLRRQPVDPAVKGAMPRGRIGRFQSTCAGTKRWPPFSTPLAWARDSATAAFPNAVCVVANKLPVVVSAPLNNAIAIGITNSAGCRRNTRRPPCHRPTPSADRAAPYPKSPPSTPPPPAPHHQPRA